MPNRPMTDTWPSLLSPRGAQFDASGHARFEPASAPASVSLIPLLHEASILVAGADAESFLQGQLSNDIRQITKAQGQPAAYCTPKGRVLATFSIWPQEGGYVLRLPLDLAERIRKRLQMYVLRSRVSLEDVSGRVALLGLAGPKSVPLLEQLIGKAPRSPYAIVQADGMSIMALPGQRIEIAVRPDSAAALWDGLVAAGAAPAGQDVWDAGSIAAGAATVLAATSDQFIPQMLNLELTGAVAFDKGCYPGQEIVARSQYRGEVKRRLYRFSSTRPAQPGASIHTSDGAVAGTVVNVIQRPSGDYELLAVALQRAGHDRFYADAGGIAPLQPLPLPYAVPESQAQSATDGE
jgi:folate-binding protein YgfZ